MFQPPFSIVSSLDRFLVVKALLIGASKKEKALKHYALLIYPCYRDGWRVWQHQAPDGVPALHAGGGHRGWECALRQEQRLLQPVRGLSLHTIYVYVEKYTDVQNCNCKSIFDHT